MKTDIVADWVQRVNSAALGFEARWTDLALRRVDPALAINLHAQRAQFNEACIVGKVKDIAEQGGATCRGYAAAIAAMELASADDDAFLLGSCPLTGIKVAIGHQKAAVERARQVHGEDVIWISPDEVATLIATAEAFTRVAGIKRAFPGAEVITRYPDEGS